MAEVQLQGKREECYLVYFLKVCMMFTYQSEIHLITNFGFVICFTLQYEQSVLELVKFRRNVS